MTCKLDTSIAIARTAGLHGQWWPGMFVQDLWTERWSGEGGEEDGYVFTIFETADLEDSSARIETAAGLGAFVLQEDFYELDDATWWKRQLACSQRLRMQASAGKRYLLPSVHYFAGESRRVSVKVTMNLIGGTPIDGTHTLVFFSGGTSYYSPPEWWGIEAGAHLTEGGSYNYLWLSNYEKPITDGGTPQPNWYIYMATAQQALEGAWKGPPIECLPDGPYVHEWGDWPDSGGGIEDGGADGHDEKDEGPEGNCAKCSDEPKMFLSPSVYCDDPPGGQCLTSWQTWYRDPEGDACLWDDRNFGGSWRSDENGLHKDAETGVWTFNLQCFICDVGATYEALIPGGSCPVGMFQKVSGSAEMPASVMIA